jgi:ArsR family transcriptional regulator
VLGCDANPLVRDPLSPAQATSLAFVFKALSDPVRLRRASWVHYRVVPQALTGLADLLDATHAAGDAR